MENHNLVKRNWSRSVNFCLHVFEFETLNYVFLNVYNINLLFYKQGEKSFFLLPGERLEKGIQNVYILGEDEGLILKTTEEFMDGEDKRAPGDRWMIRGPREYVPPVEVEVVSQRKAIPLDANEGVYVRNIKTGQVRAVVGQTYMLNQDEELWAKELPPVVEDLLAQGRDPLADRSERGKSASSKARDKTKVVVFRVPHNAAVQIYDYKDKKARYTCCLYKILLLKILRRFCQHILVFIFS